jgi:hypothetical protein
LASDEIDQITGIVADFHETVERRAKFLWYSECIKHWFVENFNSDHCWSMIGTNSNFRRQTWGNNEWNVRPIDVYATAAMCANAMVIAFEQYYPDNSKVIRLIIEFNRVAGLMSSAKSLFWLLICCTWL